MKHNTIIHARFQEGMQEIPDQSVALIIADPPYFQIKGDFDFVQTWQEWNKMLRELAEESKRVLKPNGSLFLYGHAKRIAYQQIIFDAFFELENNLTWAKKECQTKRQDFEQSRCFAPITERILFYSNGPDFTGTEYVEKEYIAPRNPFARRLRAVREAAGISVKSVAEYGDFYKNVNHGGAVSNWEKGYNIPSFEQWETMSEILPIDSGEYQGIRAEYDALRAEYDTLREEYEHKRRYFNNPNKLTDVLSYSQEANISKEFDHETVKPEGLTRAFITTCSRPGDLVLVPFSGSGTECSVAAQEGRDFIGFDTNLKYVEMGQRRAGQSLAAPALFYV